MSSLTSSLRILVVEDHHDTAQILTKLLGMAGHSVTPAETFADALAAAKAERFDLLLCDIGLSDGDGCDLIAEVSAMYPVKAIALTGYGMPAEVRRVREAGFDGFLLKPIALEELHETIQAVATGRPNAHPLWESGVSNHATQSSA